MIKTTFYVYDEEPDDSTGYPKFNPCRVYHIEAATPKEITIIKRDIQAEHIGKIIKQEGEM